MNILACQGGGCLGYGQALILQELEKRAGKPCGALFDIVAGTSVGSIIAACIASGVPASGLVDFFVKDAPTIFKSSFLSGVEALADPKYGAAGLEASLMAVLGTKTLADCTVKFIATSYDFATDRVVYFKSYEKSSSNANEIVIGYDSPVQLWQVCRASSAAQTYFPAYELDGMVLLDGGNTGDNAPDMLVLSEVMANWPGNNRMLSLGSGDTAWQVNAQTMVSPSPIRAGLETIKIVFSAGEDAQVSKARKLLGNSYYRLSPNLGNGIAIDDAEGCLTLIPHAVVTLIAASQAVLDEFC